MKTMNQKSFTLIELLVVVAIIAVLISILLPALSSARDKTRTIQCSAHLNQMGIGMHMYAENNSGVYPALFLPGNRYRTSWVLWHQLITDYISNPKLKRCPKITISDTDWDDSISTGFGLNYTGWNWKWDYQFTIGDPESGFGYIVKGKALEDQARGGCVRQSRISDTSNFIMIGDSNDSYDILSIFTYGILGPPAVFGKPNILDLPYRHNLGGNICFMDNHVEWLSAKYLVSQAAKSKWTRGDD